MTDELLQAFGFERTPDGLWFFRREFDEGEDATVVVLELEEGSFVGHLPMADDPVATLGLKKVPGTSLVFRSADVRDMVALAQSAVALVESGVLGESPLEGFGSEDDSLFIAIPFGSQYGDYVLADPQREEAHREIVGAHELHGDVYLAWRDEFCESLLGAAPAP
jgi:ribosomal protein L30/L7E